MSKQNKDIRKYIRESWRFIVWILTAIIAVIGWWTSVQSHINNKTIHVTSREKIQIENFDPNKYVSYKEFEELKATIERIDNKLDKLIFKELNNKDE